MNYICCYLYKLCLTKLKNTHHDVLWVQVVAVRAVVEVDLVERLRCHADDGTVVVPAVTVATDHLLAQVQSLRAFGCRPRLEGEKKKEII